MTPEQENENYCRQIAGLDFSALKDTLGIELQGQEVIIPHKTEPIEPVIWVVLGGYCTLPCSF